MKRNDCKDARSLVRNDGTYAHDASADYASVVSGCVAGNSSINTAKETMNQTSPAFILVSTAACDQVTNPCVRESRAERKRKQSLFSYSQAAQHLLNTTPTIQLTALDANGRLVRLPGTTVRSPGPAEGTTATDRGSTRYLGPCLSFAGDDKHRDVWREHTAACTRIVRQYEAQASDVRPNFRVMRAAAASVLYQRLKQLLLVQPPTPDLARDIRTATARTGLEALGLAKLLDHNTDSTLVDILLLPTHLGGCGIIDPIHRAVQDAAANILAGLSHTNKIVRASYYCLVAENSRRTPSPLTTHGDRTPHNRIDFLRHHAEVQLHRGRQPPPPPRPPLSYQPDRRYLLDQLPDTALQALASSAIPHPIGPAPPHRQHKNLQQTVTSWDPLPIQHPQHRPARRPSSFTPT